MREFKFSNSVFKHNLLSCNIKTMDLAAEALDMAVEALDMAVEALDMAVEDMAVVDMAVAPAE